MHAMHSADIALHSALHIPRIGPPALVPRSFTVTDASEPIIARTALTLMEAGILREGLPLRPRDTAAQILHAGLEDWLARQQAGLRTLRFGLEVWLVDRSTREQIMEPYFNVRLITHDGYWGGQLTIGPAVKRLETAHPGLGETVMASLDEAARLIPIFTPRDALSWASFAYWNGCDTDAEWQQMCIENGDDPDDFEMVTRGEFDRAIPRWVSEPRQRISARRLQQLAAQGSGKAQRVAGALHRLALARRSDNWPERLSISYDRTVILRAAMLRWGPNDPMFRIADDFRNLVMEMDEDVFEHFSEINLPVGRHDDPAAAAEATAAWRDHFEHIASVLRVMHLVDDLLVEISPATDIKALYA